MSGKKRKTIREEAEQLLAKDENYQALRKLYERGKIELQTGKRPPPEPRQAQD